MAVRDRNLFAWQAYVITMTIVSIGLLMALGFVIFTGSTSKKEAITATKNLQDMEAKLRQEGIKTQYMMYMLGAKQSTEQEVAQMEASIAGIADMEALKKSYQSDMALFGADVAQQDRNYSSLVVNLMKSLRTRNMQNDKASKDIDRLTKEMESVRVQETKGRQAAEAERDRLAKANEDARKDYEAKEGELKKEIEQLTSEKTIAQNKFNKDKNDMTVAYNKLKEERDALSKFKEKIIKERIEVEEREDFESPQAKVVYVDLNGVLVDINLGRRHGLKAGLRFSILNQDTLRMTEATPKAQIEITRVTESQATGRVIQDRNNVPVIPGDLVYSPTWRVGGTVKYAMVGKMDIDGNGSDDRQAVRDLIVRNGGEVVEDVGPDNKPSGGKLDENTRFLIVGEMPKALEGNANDPISREIGARYADIRSRARSFTVAEMTLEKLLGYLRKNDDDKTIGLGDATRGADFKERSGPLRSSLEGVRDTGIRPSGPLSGTGGR